MAYYDIETRLFLEKFRNIFRMQNLEYYNIYAGNLIFFDTLCKENYKVMEQQIFRINSMINLIQENASNNQIYRD